MNFTDSQIMHEIAKLPPNQRNVVTPDMVRIAFEWLAPQRKTKQINLRAVVSKHTIERWGGRYVSPPAVNIAATLHPEIEGNYPYYNVSSHLIRPHTRRLSQIAEAGSHPNYFTSVRFDDYASDEP